MVDKGPPEGTSSSELWLALTKLPRPHKIVAFPQNLPGTDEPVGELAIWPLTQEEQMICNAEADRFTKQLLKDPQKKDEASLGYEHTFSNETAVQVLWRACRDPNDLEKPVFPSPKMLRAQLTGDQVGALFKHYLTVQLEVGPITAWLDKDEMEAWVRRIAEGGSAFPFDLLSSEMQRSLVLFMASRLVSFWTDTSSHGSPQGDEPPKHESAPSTNGEPEEADSSLEG